VRGTVEAAALGITVLVVLATIGGCDRDRPVAFHAESVTAGPGPIGLNDPVVIRFSEPLAAALPSRALVVRTEGGSLVPVVLEGDGRHLIVRPAATRDTGGWPLWPRVPSIEVSLPVPIAGPGFESALGRALTAPFRQQVRLMDGWTRRPGNLELVESFPANGTRDISLDPEIGPFNIRLRFNGPLDQDSLESGIQVVDLRRRERVATPSLDPEDPTVAVVNPFNQGGTALFNAGTPYEVVITQGLRSRDGRTPLTDETITFTTAPGGHRLLQVGFEDERDFDVLSRHAFDPVRRVLRPKPLTDWVMSPGDGQTENEGLAALIKYDLDQGRERPLTPPEVPHVFSRCPSRAQILISGRWLGIQPRLITSVAFQSTEPIRPDTRAADLVVSLGYLDPELQAAGGGLSLDLTANVSGAQAIPLLGAPGPYRFAGSKESEKGVVRLIFAEPFHYSGRYNDLVLDITNLSGVESAWFGPDDHGIDVRGMSKSRVVGDRAVFALGRPHEPLAFLNTSFIPLFVIETRDTYPVETRWYVVEDIPSPRFLTTPAPSVRGTARAGRDFTVEYQAGRPLLDEQGRVRQLPSGAPDCEAAGSYAPLPPRGGAAAIRLRITFNNRWYPPGEQTPEIEYILLRYEGS
jgi:hypothetical protein